MNSKIAVLIPCYNEAATIEKVRLIDREQQQGDTEE